MKKCEWFFFVFMASHCHCHVIWWQNNLLLVTTPTGIRSQNKEILWVPIEVHLQETHLKSDWCRINFFPSLVVIVTVLAPSCFFVANPAAVFFYVLTHSVSTPHSEYTTLDAMYHSYVFLHASEYIRTPTLVHHVSSRYSLLENIHRDLDSVLVAEELTTFVPSLRWTLSQSLITTSRSELPPVHWITAVLFLIVNYSSVVHLILPSIHPVWSKS